MIAGYDPQRIARLGVRTRLALGDLDRITSGDAAAVVAIAAVNRLRVVLTTSFLPAVADIEATDPLARATTTNWYDGWLRTQLHRMGRTRFSDLGDIDLATMLQIELTRQIETNGIPDPDDAFWTGVFPELVAEFERRARLDPDFAGFLVDETTRNPMIGYLVAAGDFHSEVVVDVTLALLGAPAAGAVRDTYRDGAIGSLLDSIAGRPDVAVTLLAEAEVIETVLTWNERSGGAFGLDGQTIGSLFESALGHPSRIDESREILRQLVALTNSPLFDRGLPAGSAVGITAGLISHLPFLVASLGLVHDVYFQDPDGVQTTHLGSPAAVVDLFGALLRDTASRALLLAAVPALAIGTEAGLYDLDAVNDYVNTLVQAAGTEQIEEQLHTQQTKDQWNQVIAIVSSALETAFTLAGKRSAIAGQVVQIIEAGARWLVDQLGERDLEIDDVQAVAFLLLVYGVSVAFLDRLRSTGHDGNDEARELAEEIEQLLDEGAPHPEVERRILRLRDLVEDLGGDDALPSLDDPRVTPPAYDATTDAELAD